MEEKKTYVSPSKEMVDTPVKNALSQSNNKLGAFLRQLDINMRRGREKAKKALRERGENTKEVAKGGRDGGADKFCSEIENIKF